MNCDLSQLMAASLLALRRAVLLRLVLDHIPPSSWVKGLSPPLKFQWGRLWNRSGLNPLTHPSMDIHGLVNPQARRGNVQERLKTAQRLFPQCRPCSTVQGPAVNNNNRVLVPKRAVSWLLVSAWCACGRPRQRDDTPLSHAPLLTELLEGFSPTRGRS